MNERSFFLKSSNDIIVTYLLNKVAREYNLTQEISSNLVLFYTSHFHTKRTDPAYISRSDTYVLKNRKIVKKMSGLKLETHNLKVKDLTLKVSVEKGKEVVRDLTCDSKFMMDTIHELRITIHSHYSFLPVDHPVYLFIDNAGGHGKKNIKKD